MARAGGRDPRSGRTKSASSAIRVRIYVLLYLTLLSLVQYPSLHIPFIEKNDLVKVVEFPGTCTCMGPFPSLSAKDPGERDVYFFDLTLYTRLF